MFYIINYHFFFYTKISRYTRVNAGKQAKKNCKHCLHYPGSVDDVHFYTQWLDHMNPNVLLHYVILTVTLTWLSKVVNVERILSRAIIRVHLFFSLPASIFVTHMQIYGFIKLKAAHHVLPLNISIYHFLHSCSGLLPDLHVTCCDTGFYLAIKLDCLMAEWRKRRLLCQRWSFFLEGGVSNNLWLGSVGKCILSFADPILTLAWALERNQGCWLARILRVYCNNIKKLSFAPVCLRETAEGPNAHCVLINSHGRLCLLLVPR